MRNPRRRLAARSGRAASGLWLVGLLAAAAIASAQAPVARTAPARRIVSMNPSLTAILLALGAGEQLVGVDEASRGQRPELASLPTVGGLFNPNLETVVSLRSDLVLLVPSVQQRDFRRRLAELGVRVLEFDPVAFDEVLASIEVLGHAVGRSEAARDRVAAIRSARAAVERATAEREQRRVVLIIQRNPLYVIGRGSFVDAMLGAAGGRNLGAEFDAPYPRVGTEWLVASAPEVLLDASRDPEPAPSYWARFPSLPAVRQGRVVALVPGAVTLPGPYLDRALWILACALHGEGIAGCGGARR